MKVEKLLDVVQIKNPKPEKFSGEKRYYSTGNIDEHNVSENFELVKFENRPSRANVQPIENSVGFAKMKSTAKTVLVTKNHSECIFSTGMNFLVASENIISKYLYYYLISPYFLDLKDKYSGQGIMGGLSNKDLNLFKIPVPSLQEQEKIVKRLDKVFENIDKASVARENEMLSLTNLFDSFLDNKIEEFGESEQKLGEYYDVRDGTHDSPKYYEKGYPLITSKNLKDGQLNFEKIKFISEEDFNKINERSKVNKGDVLMAMIGTIGNPVVIKDNSKFAIKNVALFKLNKNQSSEYLYYFLRSNKVKKKMMAEAKGTTQKFVGLGYLRNFTITGKFDLNAENEVVFLISKIENIVNALINNQQQIYTKLLELKKSVLKKEFSYE